MAFLQKGFPEHAGAQDQICVNAGKIVEVRPDLTGHRIDRFVRIGKSIDECLHGGADQFFEGIPERIFFRAGQYGMFQNMRQSCRIFGRCPEPDGIQVFPVKGMQMQYFRPRFDVFNFIRGKAHSLYGFHPQHLEAA